MKVYLENMTPETDISQLKLTALTEFFFHSLGLLFYYGKTDDAEPHSRFTLKTFNVYDVKVEKTQNFEATKLDKNKTKKTWRQSAGNRGK